MSIARAVNTALPSLTPNLAIEIAPQRVILIAAALLDDQLEKRRDQLRTTLPIGRVVEPADSAHYCSDEPQRHPCQKFRAM